MVSTIGLRSTTAKLRGAATLAGLVLWIFVAPAWTQSATAPAALATSAGIVLALDPAQSTLHWSVGSTLHTVHGTFAIKSGRVHFDPESGNAGGEIVVDLVSGESGNGSRDKRMHKEILQTANYPEAIFRPSHVEGRVNRSGASEVKIAGVISIHGEEHALTATVHAELAGDRWHGTGQFEVPYVQWGIKDASNFLLKVQPIVEVELAMSGPMGSGK